MRPGMESRVGSNILRLNVCFGWKDLNLYKVGLNSFHTVQRLLAQKFMSVCVCVPVLFRALEYSLKSCIDKSGLSEKGTK